MSGTPTVLMKVHRGFSQFLENGAVPRLKKFVPGLPTQKARFNPGPVPVKCCGGKGGNETGLYSNTIKAPISGIERSGMPN
jgi:hypothetical protein